MKTILLVYHLFTKHDKLVGFYDLDSILRSRSCKDKNDPRWDRDLDSLGRMPIDKFQRVGGRGVKKRDKVGDAKVVASPAVTVKLVVKEKLSTSIDIGLGSYLPLPTQETTSASNAPGKSLYVNVTGKPSGKKVDFRALFTPRGNGIDVVVPVESIRAISERFVNIAYGFFLGKRVAYHIVANYVRNTWEDVGIVPVWVKLYGVPVTTFSEDGLSVIATKLGTPLMLDFYTSDMCMQSRGREGYYTCDIRVEYEWKPPRCACCKIFGHVQEECPKNIAKEVSKSNPFEVLTSVENDVELGTSEGTLNLASQATNSSGSSFWNVDDNSLSITPIVKKIDKIEKLIIEEKVTLVDDEGKPLKRLLLRESMWTVSCENADYGYDTYDDDMYEGVCRLHKLHPESVTKQYLNGESVSLSNRIPLEYSHLGKCTCVYRYCGAMFWECEKIVSTSNSVDFAYNKCCYGGRTILRPPVEWPQYIKELYKDRHFMENICAYNQMFSMTSLGANVNNSINNGKGPYVFRISGQIYHWIGSMCLTEGQPSRFLQFYIHDTANEVKNQMTNLVQLFRTAHNKYMEANIPEFKIRLYNVIGTRQYELPTTKTIGSIVFGETSGIYDAILRGDRDANNLGLHNPIFFITFTCNAKWPEIEEFMEPFPQLTTADHADIVDRVFEKKVRDYINFVRDSNTFGDVTTVLYTIEFQKRKLPHYHSLLWIDTTSKVNQAIDVEQYIFAELPDPKVDANGYTIISELMIHGPCGYANRNASCMKDGSTCNPCEVLGLIGGDEEWIMALQEATGFATTSELRKLFVHILLSFAMFVAQSICGKGKTFLWKAITTALRSKGEIVLTVASLGIASLLLPSGRTARSRFQLPLNLKDECTCHIKKNSQLVDLLRRTNLIIWDEAPINYRRCFEALDRCLRDILDNLHTLFVGRIIMLGGDFRQTLPVKKKASKPEIIDAPITSSYLWAGFKIYTLTYNMRLYQSGLTKAEKERLNHFSAWLLDIGNGSIGTPDETENKDVFNVHIPSDLCIPDSDMALTKLIDFIYDDITLQTPTVDALQKKAIVSPTNESADMINAHVLSLVNHDQRIYLSCDEAIPHGNNGGETELLYPTNYLNSLNFCGFPPHMLQLKVGAPVTLLCNLNIAACLCNGTRLIMTQLLDKVIEARIITGIRTSEKVFFPRIPLINRDLQLPFIFKRKHLMTETSTPGPIPIDKGKLPLVEAITVSIADIKPTQADQAIEIRVYRKWVAKM
nr:DNA helicase [Tanacetum cinerariifolium]